MQVVSYEEFFLLDLVELARDPAFQGLWIVYPQDDWAALVP